MGCTFYSLDASDELDANQTETQKVQIGRKQTKDIEEDASRNSARES